MQRLRQQLQARELDAQDRLRSLWAAATPAPLVSAVDSLDYRQALTLPDLQPAGSGASAEATAEAAPATSGG